MIGLNIRKDSCALDFLALGALVHRLDPGVIPFRKARSVEIHVSGGEYNVAAYLADCFGLKTGIATAMVNYGIGELVQPRVREMGVRPFYKWFEHDGVRGPNIATVYSDRGQGVRPPVVFYNRAHEAGGARARGGRARPEHRHGLQRPRPGRASARRLLQPGQRGGRPAEAGRLRLAEDLRRRR